MTETVEGRTHGVVAEAKEKGQAVVADTQEHLSTKAQELGGEAANQIRAQFDQRSTQAGEQVQAIGAALQSGATQLRVEGQDLPAKIVTDVARRTDDLGAYLKSAQADQILGDIESFARRRPWLAAGAAALAGFMASRFVKASGDRRYAAASNGRDHSGRSLPAGDT